MITKRILLILSIFVISSIVYSQVKIDILYFKDGSLTKGHILQQLPDSTILFKKLSGDVKTYKSSDIVKIAKDIHNESNPPIKNNAKMNILIRIGGLTSGKVYYDSNSGTFDENIFVVGIGMYQLVNPNIRSGFQIEYNKYPNGKVVPIYGDLRLRHDGSILCPYLLLNFGYSLAWIDGLKGMNGDGLYGASGFGIEILTTEETAILIEGSVAYQGSESFQKYYLETKKSDVSYVFLKASISFLF